MGLVVSLYCLFKTHTRYTVHVNLCEQDCCYRLLYNHYHLHTCCCLYLSRRLRVDHVKGFYAPNQKKKEGEVEDKEYKPSGAEGQRIN